MVVLPTPRNAGEKERVGNPIRADRVCQRCRDVLLTDEFFKGLRSVFSCKNGVGHLRGAYLTPLTSTTACQVAPGRFDLLMRHGEHA